MLDEKIETTELKIQIKQWLGMEWNGMSCRSDCFDPNFLKKAEEANEVAL